MKLQLTTEGATIPAMICIAALGSMLTGRHFSICKIREAAKVARVELSRDVLDKCSALHCVAWEMMPHDLRQWVLGVCDALVCEANKIA